MGNFIGRTTSRILAATLGQSKDTAVAFIRIGGFILVWEDKSKRAHLTTIDTKEFLGRD